MTLVSIVTISFNQARFLERTILSILAQDYPAIEYIVVDPGSTDGSREIIEQYRSRIDKVIFRPDQGAADGLNNGFCEATGKIFGFVNSDDMLLAGAVSSAVRFLEQHKDVDVISGHSNVIGPDDCVLRRLFSDRMSIQRALYGGTTLIQPSTFFRKEIFDRVGGFSAQNRVCWDSELFLKMALAGGRFAVMNETWSAYRIHSESTTNAKTTGERTLRAQEEFFYQVTGRRWKGADRMLIFWHRMLRHILNPRDTWERIRKGPINRQVFDG